MDSWGKTKTYNAVSLFSNCGAGDIGFRNAGFEFNVMAELDSRRLDVCLLNHPNAVGVPGDLRETWSTVISKYLERCGGVAPALICACPPCQGMSSARSGRGKAADADAGSKDSRNLLVEIIASVTQKLQPKILVVENVTAFLTRKVRHPDTGTPISAANLLISRLSAEYVVYPFLADLCEYGVPQVRRRAFLTFISRELASHLTDDLLPYPQSTHTIPISISEALQTMNLPALDARTSELAKSTLPLHFVPVWAERQYEMVKAIPVNSGATAWQNTKCLDCGDVTVGTDDVLCPKCHAPLLRPIVHDGNGKYRFVKGFRTSSYRRMAPDKPASTITTASGHIGSDNSIHPFEHRLLSALECAKIQTFPDDFQWGDALRKWGHTNVRSMIGEAVPPLFTELHGRVLVDMLEAENSVSKLRSEDKRYKTAVGKLASDSG